MSTFAYVLHPWVEVQLDDEGNLIGFYIDFEDSHDRGDDFYVVFDNGCLRTADPDDYFDTYEKADYNIDRFLSKRFTGWGEPLANWPPPTGEPVYVNLFPMQLPHKRKEVSK